MRMFRVWKALQKPCWCGAGIGDRCRDRNGKTVLTHNTRGVFDRKTIDALSEAAGVTPKNDG